MRLADFFDDVASVSIISFLGLVIVLSAMSAYYDPAQWSPGQKSAKMLAVTGYWDLGEKSREKDNHTKFMKSFEKTTVFNVDYAVYGEDSVISSIQEIRSRNKVLEQNRRLTHGQIMSFDEMVGLCDSEFGSDAMKKISQTSLNDPDHCPSTQLLLVWLAKVLVVRKAIESFPDYTHFGWIDTGYKGSIADVARKWPCDSLESIQGLHVRRISDACKKSFWREQRMQLSRCPIGGMWFGDKKSVLEFIEHSIGIIRDNIWKGKTVCADQDIFELAQRRMSSDVHDHGCGDESYNAIFV